MNHQQKLFSPSQITLAVLLAASPMAASAATAPSLGTASSFAALSGAGLTCTGSAVAGDVGSLLTVTGFPPPTPALCTITGGAVHAADVTVTTAHTDLFGATGTNSALAAQVCDFNHAATEQLSGQTLASGVHCFPSDALLNGPAPLNLVGNGPWILRMGTALTTGATSPAIASVLVNGQANCGTGVFWQIGSSATIGSNTAMVGNILAQASITFTGVNSTLVGGAFANVAAVTMTGTSITTCGATLPPPPPPHGDGDHDGDDGDHDGDHDGDDGDHDGHHGDKDKHHGDKDGHDSGYHNNPFGSNDKHDKHDNK